MERTKLKADFLKASDKFGSLQDAGKALFDGDILPFKSDAGGIQHNAVAQDILIKL